MKRSQSSWVKWWADGDMIKTAEKWSTGLIKHQTLQTPRETQRVCLGADGNTGRKRVIGSTIILLEVLWGRLSLKTTATIHQRKSLTWKLQSIDWQLSEVHFKSSSLPNPCVKSLDSVLQNGNALPIEGTLEVAVISPFLRGTKTVSWSLQGSEITESYPPWSNQNQEKYPK